MFAPVCPFSKWSTPGSGAEAVLSTRLAVRAESRAFGTRHAPQDRTVFVTHAVSHAVTHTVTPTGQRGRDANTNRIRRVSPQPDRRLYPDRMTREVRLPDDVARDLAAVPDPSAYVAEAVRERLARDRFEQRLHITPEGRARARALLAAADSEWPPERRQQLRARFGRLRRQAA